MVMCVSGGSGGKDSQEGMVMCVSCEEGGKDSQQYIVNRFWTCSIPISLLSLKLSWVQGPCRRFVARYFSL